MSSKWHPVEVLCACCGELGQHGGRWLCRACHQRHRNAGTLNQHPVVGHPLPTLWRIESYAELRGRGLSVQEAAERLDVTHRTGWRYEARIKAVAA